MNRDEDDYDELLLQKEVLEKINALHNNVNDLSNELRIAHQKLEKLDEYSEKIDDLDLKQRQYQSRVESHIARNLVDTTLHTYESAHKRKRWKPLFLVGYYGVFVIPAVLIVIALYLMYSAGTLSQSGIAVIVGAIAIIISGVFTVANPARRAHYFDFRESDKEFLTSLGYTGVTPEDSQTALRNELKLRDKSNLIRGRDNRKTPPPLCACRVPVRGIVSDFCRFPRGRPTRLLFGGARHHFTCRLGVAHPQAYARPRVRRHGTIGCLSRHPVGAGRRGFLAQYKLARYPTR